MQKRSFTDDRSDWQKLREMPGALHLPPHTAEPSPYKPSLQDLADIGETPSAAMLNWQKQRDEQDRLDALLSLEPSLTKIDESPLAGGKYSVTKKHRTHRTDRRKKGGKFVKLRNGTCAKRLKNGKIRFAKKTKCAKKTKKRHSKHSNKKK